MNRTDLKRGLQKSIPVILGYAPVAVAYGLLTRSVGMSLIEALCFSIIVYAGASQFMSANLIGTGVDFFSIVFTTFLINLRGLMLSASLGIHMDKVSKRAVPLVSFLITDETFSIAYFNKEHLSTSFMLGLGIPSYASWVIFTGVGYVVGEILPPSVQVAMGVGLSAMFVSLLVPPIKRDRKGLWVALVSMGVFAIIHRTKFLPNGWDLVVAICLSSLISMVFYRSEVAN